MDKVIIDGVDVSIPVKLRPNRTDLTDKKFGKLTVIKPVISAKIGRKAHSRWLCQCECGNYKVAYTFSLTSGNTQSCGCLLHKPNTYVKRLKAENERLKEEVETWNYQADKRAELSNIWFNTAEKYKQTLQEIRKIAKEQLQDVSDRCINTTPMYIVHKQIIDKINEVIGAE